MVEVVIGNLCSSHSENVAFGHLIDLHQLAVEVFLFYSSLSQAFICENPKFSTLSFVISPCFMRHSM